MKESFELIKKRKWLISVGFALLIFILVKAFLFDLFKVNNYDMLSTYTKGDVLVIKKSFNHLMRGEVVAIDYPSTDSSTQHTSFVQRIAALPGDCLEVSNKQVYVNGILQNEVPTLQYNYFIKSNGIKLDSLFKQKYCLKEGGKVSDEFDYSYALTPEQKTQLEKDSLIKGVQLKIEKKNLFDERCFPGSAHCSWNADQYGKIYIPKRNDSLAIDTGNILLYETLIIQYEHNQMEIREDSIFINAVYSTFYQVKQNYYFLLGDNRDNANDSRSWGFLPESAIRGKVITRIKSARK